MCYQLCFAWQPLTIFNNASTVGINTYQAGTNTWTWYKSVATAPYQLGALPAETAFTASGGGSYTAGGFTQSTVTSQVSIPANTYFLIGVSGGPYYRSFYQIGANRTATIGGNPYVTVINRVFYGSWATGPASGIPNQIGGATSGYTDLSGYSMVVSVKF